MQTLRVNKTFHSNLTGWLIDDAFEKLFYFCSVCAIITKTYLNKKVLLRERKRHTDRGVSSTTRWVAPPPPGQGTPPPARSDRGRYPRWGNPPAWTWLGYPPCLDLAGVPPPTWTWLGNPPPPPPGPGWGTPLQVCTDRRMDRHVSKHNLPSYYVRGR